MADAAESALRRASSAAVGGGGGNPEHEPAPGEGAAPPPEWRELIATFGRIALQSFGGPAGQIAVAHRILVEEKRWLSESRFLHALNYCMLLPGPEATQLVTYAGWLARGTAGGVVAGGLFLLPGVVSLYALSLLYASFGATRGLAALFFGLKAAVLALVCEAIWRLGKRALGTPARRVVAAAGFLAMVSLAVPYPWLIALAALVGFAAESWSPGSFAAAGHGAPPPAQAAGQGLSWRRSAGVLVTWLAVWLAPILLVGLIFGRTSVWSELGWFFAQVATVSFGGAYAVLAYVAEHAVEVGGWLAAGEMVDGLGLAETTPGPLIMVVQFVGFLAGWRSPGALEPWAAATLASAVVTWATFVPSFLFIFLGAPYVEALRGRRRLDAALGAITATVVGVIAHLAWWFAQHVLFAETAEWQWGPLRLLQPEWSSLDVRALLLFAAAAWLLLGRRWGMAATIATVTAAGAGLHLLA